MRSACTTRSTPSSSRRRNGSSARCSRFARGATISRSRRWCGRTSTGCTAQQLEATWNQHRAETEKLKNSLRDLNDKIEEAKRKKNLLIARAKRAEAQARIAETMSSMSEKSAFEAFSRMETKIEDNERRMLANVEIDEEFSGDKLASDFKVLEKGAGAASADMQLLALKQKMGVLPAGAPGSNKQIGAGDSNEETVHAEIEDPEEQKKLP